MQCYTQLLPPTAVTHAVSLPFLTATTTNLVVAKTSLLQIFRFKTVKRRKANDSGKGEEGPDAGDITKLVLIGEYSLSGTVTSLARVKIEGTKAGGDALLVSFKDAKVSLVEWDPGNHRISTISIHYYEGDKVQSAPFGPPLSECDSKLTVDPRSRCAALRFGPRHLAIIPFRQPDDDIADADYHPDLDEAPAGKKEQRREDKDDNPQKVTPYAASFVLPLTALDPGLTHPVDLSFLYEYREPTFGIVSSSKAASSALLDERKDPLSYTVYTLDLEQRASTTLLSVSGLPHDIFKLIPLPPPVGGTLLVGCNELVHIDQSGKTSAVGVNEFARQSSNFPMTDQSTLALRLENCTIEPLGYGSSNLAIFLASGELAILTFRIDGRNVSGLSVHPVVQSQGGDVGPPVPSASAVLSNGQFFIASDQADSVVISWTQKVPQLSRKRSHAQMESIQAEPDLDEDDLDDDDDDAEDDLYGAESRPSKKLAAMPTIKASSPSDYDFHLHDRLPCLGPINSICIGKPRAIQTRPGLRAEETIDSALSFLASVGSGKASALAFLNKEITPSILHSKDSQSTQAIWSIEVGKPGDGDAHGGESASAQSVRYIVTNEINQENSEESRIFRTTDATSSQAQGSVVPWSEVDGTEFEREGETLNVGMLATGTRIVHVRKSEIRTYDADLGLSQIFPVLDSATDEELQVVHSSFCDPYLLLIRNDSSIQILQADKSGDLDEVEAGEDFASSKWLSGCIYSSGETSLAFLLGSQGGLQIYKLPDLKKPVYSAPNLSDLPAVLSVEEKQRRAGTKETLTEMIVADLGDEDHKSPYLIVRSSTDDLTIYEPFHYPTPASDRVLHTVAGLRFRKIPGVHIPKYNEGAEEQRPSPLRALVNVGGRCCVFMAGASPCFVMRDVFGLPYVIGLRGKAVKALAGFTSNENEKGFTYIDSSGTLHLGQLPRKTTYMAGGWAVKKFSPLPFNHDIHHLSYHAERNLYALVSSEPTPFHLPEEDYKAHELDEDITLRPTAAQYYVHLYDANADTLISTYTLPPYEMVTSLTVASLEISETTHAHASLIAAGTITQRGEAYAAKGSVYVFDIADVVPEPSQPETGRRLSLRSREETRAGITALTGVAGLLATGQGQKILFRGLREDGQNLPVGFLDAQTYITSLKTLGASKLWLAADAWKGLWFGGFNEEPYKLTLFGKSRSKMEVVAADFLPADGALFLVVVDANMDLHVLQYDPENPKSLAGQRLLSRSTFHTGHMPTNMVLLPSTLAPFEAQEDMANGDSEGERGGSSMYQVLVTSASGAINLLTPLDEDTYRRLSVLQTHLTNVLEHPCGLNPRAYRNVESEEGLGGARGVVDGDLICRVGELGAARRNEVLGRAGMGAWELRSDLEILAGGGLGYL